MNIKYGKSKRIMASESDGNYDKSFKAKGTTYYIEMLSGAGNYVAKWWDSSDNGLGYNNKGWVAIEGKNYRALNNISDVSSDNIIDLLSVVSDYDRKPGKPIQDRIKREVAKLLDFDAINSACGKKSVKAAFRDNTVDTDAVRELVLTITNDGDQYRRQITPAIDNLKRKYKKGTYNRDLAVKLWQYVADEGVRRYNKEFGSGTASVAWLNPATRKAIAEELRDYYEEEIMYDDSINASRRAVKASRTLEIYTYGELTPEQQAYVVDNWSSMRKLADVIYEWHSEDIMFGYNDEAQYIADQYASKYGLSINPDKLYWQSGSQGPYPEWDLSKVFDEYQLNDGTEIYFYGRGLDVEAETDSWGEEVESPEIDEVVGHAQEYIDEMWKYINDVCQAYPDDEWVAQCMESNPEAFEFTISDSGEVKYY